MNVTTIASIPGSRHRRKRVGRGIGSGHGKTSTRGQKGQRARTGSGKRPGFEGGRNPLIRRMPKRGFRQKATGLPLPVEIVNVRQLEQFQDGAQITPDQLKASGLIREPNRGVKLLGDGALTKRLRVLVHHASESAKTKVLAAGGTVELIDLSQDRSRLKAQGSRQAPPASSLQPPA